MTQSPALILVIDDDPFARAFAEGLAMAADAAPRLILLDYAMPGMTGLDALLALRSGTVAPRSR